MKKMFFLLVLALVVLRGFSQNMDSLAVAREVDSLIQVSRTLTGKRDFDKALEINAVAEKLALEKLGRESAAYGSCCHNQGRVYSIKGNYPESEKWYIEALAIREKVLGKEHPEYAISLVNLANLYVGMGKHEKAEPLLFEALAILENTKGKEHLLYAQSLNNLARLYFSISNYEKAEPLLLEALAILEKALGKEHQNFAQSLNNLAILYNQMGNYEKAEPLYLEAKAIREKVSGKEHPDYATSLNSLATLYHRMGNYKKAEPLYLEALAIWEKAKGKEHPEYSQSLNNLAVLYFGIGNYEKAELFYLEAIAINEKVLGEEHPDYCGSLINLASLYKSIGNYEKAEPLYFEAKEIFEVRLNNRSHPFYMNCLNNMAALYKDVGDNKKAELLNLEAKAIREKTFGKEHPDNALGLYNLAILYSDMGNYEKAEPLLNELATVNQTLIANALRHLSERELNSYINMFSKSQNETLSFAQLVGSNPEVSAVPRYFEGQGIRQTCYDNSLFYKGFLLHAAVQVKGLALSDSVTTEKFNRLKGCQRRLAAQYAMPIAERDSAKVAEIETQANDLEKDLTRTVAGYGEASRHVKWNEVQQKLKPGEAAVEFVHYQYWGKKQTDSTMYAALLLRPDWPQPRMVALFEQKAIQPLLNAANTSAAADQLYAARGGKKRGQAKKSEGIGIGETANLYQLIWQPLDSLLQGVKTVYFSPSGLLHRLNLAAIPVPPSGGQGGKTLADRYRLVQVGSTRQLVVGTGSSSGARTAALFGGLRFDAQNSAALDTAVTTSTYDAVSLRRSLGARGGDTWNYLPGTEKEIRNIAKPLGKSGYKVQSSTGYDGTEAAFKTIGSGNLPSPTVLHIATHGFFFPDPKDTLSRKSSAVDLEPVFKTSDNPLMRSGLILAGANRSWAGGKTLEGQEDGILTAYEISQMNLSATELVVLSACETGLGDVSGNEGVYGLQRAFKIAGAKYLIMSLWQVPDKQTSLLMTTFYKKWLEEKMEIPKAFRAAQKEMREQGFDPYQWAGFVLLE